MNPPVELLSTEYEQFMMIQVRLLWDFLHKMLSFAEIVNIWSV